jgi:hypothetical protein
MKCFHSTNNTNPDCLTSDSNTDISVCSHVRDTDLFKRCSILSSDQAFQDIWSNERLVNVAEQILGTSDIIGHPVWNLRTKTPNSEAATVPWHQGKWHKISELNFRAWFIRCWRRCRVLLNISKKAFELLL